MVKRRFAGRMLLVGLMVLGASLASGQNYPNRPVRLIVGSIGSGTDLLSRVIAQGLTGPLGQQVIVENRPTIVLGDVGAKAAPDGHTLMVTGTSLWIAPFLRKTSYDPVRDFLPITLAERSPNVLLVLPSLPAKSVRELIALAKSKPGALKYASGAPGSSVHLVSELFKAKAGVDILRIPYQGTGPAIVGLLAGEADLIFSSTPPVTPHVKAGRLRALAVTSAEPSALAPGLPTVAASGLPGFESQAVTGIFAPAKTPAAIITRLNQELVRFLNTSEAKESLFGLGVEPFGNSPKEAAAWIESEMATLGKIIKDAGIRAD